MADILVVDDDKMLGEMLTEQMGRSGHQAVAVFTLLEGLKQAHTGAFDLVFLDVQMPDGNGLEFLPEFRKTSSRPEVIVITGKGDPDGAERAIKGGAWAYIEKPHILQNITLHLNRALQYKEEKKRVALVPVALKRDNIIGTSPAIVKCLDQLAKAAVYEVSVLITGETGTGKEIFARAIHDNSLRSTKNFVVVDCASLPENLIESTLFGHMKGAFTGADQARDGLIKQADGGTLFLDEIGELPINIQKAFLRVLQEHSFRPVGGSQEMRSDFRLVAATNRDLNQRVQNGTFRRDLLFRLQAFSIGLPPLRERIEDIQELAISYIGKLCQRYGHEMKGFGSQFFKSLAVYDWPGNVRELHQSLEQVLVNASHTPTIYANHLPEHIRIMQARSEIMNNKHPSPFTTKNLDKAFEYLPTWRESKETFEQDYMRKLMSLSENNLSEASRISGLGRTRIYQLLKKYELAHPDA